MERYVRRFKESPSIERSLKKFNFQNDAIAKTYLVNLENHLENFAKSRRMDKQDSYRSLKDEGDNWISYSVEKKDKKYVNMLTYFNHKFAGG